MIEEGGEGKVGTSCASEIYCVDVFLALLHRYGLFVHEDRRARAQASAALASCCPRQELREGFEASGRTSGTLVRNILNIQPQFE